MTFAEPPGLLKPAKRKWTWPVLVVLLIGLLLARGFMVLCIMPPFEAWDEMYHVAYIQHVLSTHQAPTLQVAIVRNESLFHFITFPLPMADSAMHVNGAVGYADYFDAHHARPVLKRPHDPVGLYEAQHPPLFYRLAAPLFKMAGGLENLRQSVAVVRLANLLLWAATVAVIGGLSRKIFVDRQYPALLVLWLVCQPILLLNSARISNDALCIFCGTLVVGWCFLIRDKHVYPQALLIGLLAGAAIWSKALALALLPFIAVSLLLSGIEYRWPKRKTVMATMIALISTALVTSKYFLFNLQHFGMLSPLGEAVQNRQNGKTFVDLFAYLHPDRWIWWTHAWAEWWSMGALWSGGWSQLVLPWGYGYIYAGLLAAGLLGWLLCLVPSRWRSRRRVFKRRFVAVRCLAICGFLSAALSYHCLHAILFYHLDIADPTPPWYTSLGVPFLFMLVIGGYAQWFSAKKPLELFGLAVPILCLVSEQIGLWQYMIPTYGATSKLRLALKRIATLHPGWMPRAAFYASLAAAAICLVGSIIHWWRLERPLGAGQTTSTDSRRGGFEVILPE